MTEKRFEEWIAHPSKRAFVPIDDHSAYAGQQGWWATGWRGTAIEVEARKSFYASRPSLVLEPESEA
jgi:hypothetical protein